MVYDVSGLNPLSSEIKLNISAGPGFTELCKSFTTLIISLSGPGYFHFCSSQQEVPTVSDNPFPHDFFIIGARISATSAGMKNNFDYIHGSFQPKAGICCHMSNLHYFNCKNSLMVHPM